MIKIVPDKYKYGIYILFGIVVIGFTLYIYNKVSPKDYGHKVVVCIPVYGQSYALGEEATRITNFDSLRIKYNGRIVTEKLDYSYGFYDSESRFKQWVKRILHYDRRAYELSIYAMAEELASELGSDTLICIFPGGAGMSTIAQLMKPAPPYLKFIKEIECAYKKACERGWDFVVPAVCWMQGESDIVEYPEYDYKEYFHRMYKNLNNDIKLVTHQKDDIRIISYQSTTITKGLHYKANNYYATEPKTPTAQMELIRDDSLIWASGPTYPYDFVNESLHIDAVGQQSIGKLAARSALGLLRKDKRNFGVVPISYKIVGNEIRIQYNVPCPPLCIDTISVRKADNYGFNVICGDGTDIISDICVDYDKVILNCKKSPQNCKLRYAINGNPLKGGRMLGARGNLRDAQSIIHNWGLLYEVLL